VTPALEAAYAQPHRRYHTRVHIEDCLGKLAAVGGLSARDRRILEYALWWHDAIYDPTRGDNEDLSADMASRDLAAQGEDAAAIADVDRLIRLTKGHTVSAADRLGALMVSIDLSILGAPPAAYDAYSAQVREEYAHVPEAEFRAGRRAVLEGFLKAPILFPDAAFAAQYDAQARANLRREIERLA